MAARLAGTLVGGVWADRVSPGRIMVASDVVRALSTLAIAGYFATGQDSVPLLCGLAAVTGGAAAFFGPAFVSLRPLLVAVERRHAANATLNILQNSAFILGPAAAGVFVAWAGAPWAFVVNAVSFLVSAGDRRGHPRRRAARPAHGHARGAARGVARGDQPQLVARGAAGRHGIPRSFWCGDRAGRRDRGARPRAAPRPWGGSRPPPVPGDWWVACSRCVMPPRRPLVRRLALRGVDVAVRGGVRLARAPRRDHRRGRGRLRRADVLLGLLGHRPAGRGAALGARAGVVVGHPHVVRRDPGRQRARRSARPHLRHGSGHPRGRRGDGAGVAGPDVRPRLARPAPVHQRAREPNRPSPRPDRASGRRLTVADLLAARPGRGRASERQLV